MESMRHVNLPTDQALDLVLVIQIGDSFLVVSVYPRLFRKVDL